jgi:hypothetical protein
MKIQRAKLLAIAIVVLSPLFGGRAVYAAHPTVRWDLVSIQLPNIFPGGHASARTNNDLFKITLTGSGTFRLKPGNPQATGGGTFEIRDQSDTVVNSGTYAVTWVVRFEQAPGTLPPLTDQIGDPDEAHGGLAILNIEYSDGAEGILVVSCHLVGTPNQVFEGITVTHRFVDFWNREAPSDDPFIDANRTLFHISP